ncbi:MAG: hypothetical protein FWG84_04060 [Bacteroidales bacterium]|nr:hypothetical protein [Bacteroidales bacterium]
MCQRKILIVENQVTQFESLQTLFKQYATDFEIFPKDFFPFIAWVRRYVNINYPETLHTDSSNNIVQRINDNKIELILMDYKLGAQFESKSGVVFATEINKKLEKPLPVVFMSKDLIDNNEKYCDELEKYKAENFPECKCVHKGYFGREILQKDYFEAKMIPALKNCLSDSDNQTVVRIIRDKIDNLQHDLTGDDARTKRNLEEIVEFIKKGGQINSNTRQYILSKKDTKNFNDFNKDLVKNYR